LPFTQQMLDIFQFYDICLLVHSEVGTICEKLLILKMVTEKKNSYFYGVILIIIIPNNIKNPKFRL